MTTLPPLEGVRVLELGSTIAGPFCGRLLADFGAEVIKIEPPEGDPVRTMGLHFEGQSLYAASILRNKSLVCLDLRKPEGQLLARDLALQCDVIVENFKPGTLERWGLGYEELALEKPSLVLVRISGFGQTGPYSGKAGYGVIGEAVSGLRHVTGDPDRPPARVAVSLTDYVTGLYGAFGAVMAVFDAYRRGRGQVVDCSLYESVFSFMEPHVPAYDKLGVIANREGSRLPGSNPNNLYPTADGDFIHITAMADPVFKRLCNAMDNGELASNPQFCSARGREENHVELDDLIGRWTLAHPLAVLEQILEKFDVPATRIFRMDDIFRDPHFKSREMLWPAFDEHLGSVVLAAPVPKLSATPGTIRHAGRGIGANTREVLSSVLKLSFERIDELAAKKTIRLAEELHS
jgi:crotonobetainyl-CoA:carnitine CoA-transferase CaiB-like acyl-CoA transferase